MREFRDLAPTKARRPLVPSRGLYALGNCKRSPDKGSRSYCAPRRQHHASFGTILRFAVSEGYIEDDPSAGIDPRRCEGSSATPGRGSPFTTPDEIWVLDAAAAHVSTGNPKDPDRMVCGYDIHRRAAKNGAITTHAR